MDGNFLITGYLGEPHVTVENDRGINAGIVGEGRFVLPVGKRFKAEYIGNNTIRMYDGKLMDNGAAAGIPAGEYIDFRIPNASQGMNRNDLICFGYEQQNGTMLERGFFDVLSGNETRGTASDPDYKQYEGDLLSGNARSDIMPLWRIRVSTGTISEPEQVFEVTPCLCGTKSVSEGGTGLSEITTGNFLVGNGTKAMVEKTPKEVLDMINGVSKTDLLNSDFVPWSELSEQGFLSFDTLWENANSQSNFAAQSFSVQNMSKYMLIAIVCNSGFYFIGNYGTFQSMCHNRAFSNNHQQFTRNVTINGNNIEFSDCLYSLYGNATSVSNDTLIPYTILGVKGLVR